MARTPSNENRSPRSRTPRAAAPQPARRTVADASAAADAPSFPFARTAEDDELRDMSGYGWGV